MIGRLSTSFSAPIWCRMSRWLVGAARIGSASVCASALAMRKTLLLAARQALPPVAAPVLQRVVMAIRRLRWMPVARRRVP